MIKIENLPNTDRVQSFAYDPKSRHLSVSLKDDLQKYIIHDVALEEAFSFAVQPDAMVDQLIANHKVTYESLFKNASFLESVSLGISNIMAVKFLGGDTYILFNATLELYHDFITAPSAGKFFNSYIKPNELIRLQSESFDR